MRTISALFVLVDKPVFLLRHGRQGLAGGALVAPGRHHQPHADVALDGANYVHAAADGPPAIARPLHEGEALQPLAARKRRSVAAETPAVQLEAEQSEPVLQAQHADEFSAPGRVLALPAQRARRAPERKGIESGDDDAAL